MTDEAEALVADAVKKQTEFETWCGAILRYGCQLESHIDFYLAKYLSSPGKKFEFIDSFLRNLNFERKKQLLLATLERLQVEDGEVNEIRKHIGEVQSIRNQVAHWDCIYDMDSGFTLKPRKASLQPKDLRELNEDLVVETLKHRDAAIKKLARVYNEQLR